MALYYAAPKFIPSQELFMQPNPSFQSFLDVVVKMIAARVADNNGPSHKNERRLPDIEQAAIYLRRTTESSSRMGRQGALPFVRTDRSLSLDVRDLDRRVKNNKSISTEIRISFYA